MNSTHLKRRKYLAALTAAALLSLSLAGCGNTPAADGGSQTPTPTVTAPAQTPSPSAPVQGDEPEGRFTAPGTYSAAAPGRNGTVTLTATFSSSAIESITTESDETPTIGVTAMDTLTDLVLANQSLGVDAVAGATLSCEAFLQALEDCVLQAGGDPEALKSQPVSQRPTADYPTQADVIVVGAGGAGLSAALTASENGASVILLEKSGMVGGNTLCATMGINAAASQVQTDAGVSVTVEDFVTAQLNNEDAREDLVRALCSRSGETINWLTSLGVEFTVGGNSDFMLLAEADGKTSVTLVNALYRALQKTDVALCLHMDATELLTENGAVVGVKATDANGSSVDFTGKSVILCTGGFGQNRELLAQVRPDLANAITDEIAPTTGEGLLMAQALGSDTVNLDAIQLFPHVVVGYGLLTPNNLPGGFHPKAIYVNQDAQRFTAEGFEVSDAILAQPDGMAYCIFNEADLSDGLKELTETGFVVSGDTPSQLAQALGLDPQALEDTVQAWNDICAAGADDQFGRQDNLEPLEGKLYGYNFGVGAHYFMGGILINDATQVLNVSGQPIPGLYAAGEVTGGFHGTYRVDGCGTADACVFGRLAGDTAAAQAR